MTNIVVVTTFPSNCWQVYAKKMLQSFVQFWPADVQLLIQLDDDLLVDEVPLRQGDAAAVGWNKEHADFVARNKDKDDPTNYRKQAVRFSHKVFTIHRAMKAMREEKEAGNETPRYLIWMDADVVTTRQVTMEDIQACLPKEGDAVSYLGRKDWHHSECGWLAFDLLNGGEKIIDLVYNHYVTDTVFAMEEWHDSWVWDTVLIGNKCTNLTEDKPGMDIWPESPMGAWSTHYKGPVAKSALMGKTIAPRPANGSNVIIQTKNAIPEEEIRAHISRNQELITKWIKPCLANDEEVIVVSAGPMLVAEDLRAEGSGKRIVAVKHALTPLKKAGIKPWACILLDPRPHVADFVQDADPDIIWFVASQVNPLVTEALLARGCNIWGYHASVNAGEESLTVAQKEAIISGGSATATRGLFLLNHLGFEKMALYGYDLCMPDKPDLEAKDERGQPKYFELSIGINDPLYSVKRIFYSEPQLIAQFEELNELIKSEKFKIRAVGDGIVPFMLKAKNTADLRRSELRVKMMGETPQTYMELLNG